MTLTEIIERASRGYEKTLPESPLTQQAAPDGYPLSREDYNALAEQGEGDLLARFIVSELGETYDREAGDEEQLAESVRSIESIIDQLQDVADALRRAE